jgi:ribosomal-protein-alanine N-acetyltransferase
VSEALALPRDLTSSRLRLILVSPDDAADMFAGRRQSRWHRDYPRRDDVDAASLVRPGGPADPWGPRHIVWEQQAIGSIGCFGPPVEGEVEVGYGLVEEARGRGIATEALACLLAATDALAVRVRASVSPTNRAGVRVLATAGFTELRGSNDDGELVMGRPLGSV